MSKCRAIRRTTDALRSFGSNTSPGSALGQLDRRRRTSVVARLSGCRGAFSKILQELTNLNIRTDGSNILAIDDPELFNYPVAYMAEPGFWGVTEKEATALRAYLLKGGFLIFDDFRGPHWDNLQEQMRVVLPEANWIRAGWDGEDISFVLRDRSSGEPPRAIWEPHAVVLGVVRRQRSEEAADGHRQRQQRHQ